jgi:MarR family transcriptional regulator, temperature-dependent positive regulator of motility
MQLGDFTMSAVANQPRHGAANSDPLEIYGMPGHLIRRMHQASTAIFAAETSKAGYDLTPVQYAALTAIQAFPGLDQATLASAIAHDRVTIGGVIDRLEQKGLVRRKIVKGDKRSRRLHLQPRGEEALKRVTPIVRQLQDIILQGLSERERVVFVELLSKALDAVGDLSRAPLRPVAPK